jgi:hypothetical protein
MDGVLKAAKEQRGILIKRIQLLEARGMITHDVIKGIPIETTEKTLAEIRVLLGVFDKLISRYEASATPPSAQ